jgi:hypothetical protein
LIMINLTTDKETEKKRKNTQKHLHNFWFSFTTINNSIKI